MPHLELLASIGCAERRGTPGPPCWVQRKDPPSGPCRLTPTLGEQGVSAVGGMPVREPAYGLGGSWVSRAAAMPGTGRRGPFALVRVLGLLPPRSAAPRCGLSSAPRGTPPWSSALSPACHLRRSGPGDAGPCVRVTGRRTQHHGDGAHGTRRIPGSSAGHGGHHRDRLPDPWVPPRAYGLGRLLEADVVARVIRAQGGDPGFPGRPHPRPVLPLAVTGRWAATGGCVPAPFSLPSGSPPATDA